MQIKSYFHMYVNSAGKTPFRILQNVRVFSLFDFEIRIFSLYFLIFCIS